jgi:hypothetical protein
VLLPPLATAALLVVPRQWRRGAAWVNFVGIDGYYRRSRDTFSSVFGRTIAQIRTFSNAPALITQRSDRNNITRIQSSM